MATESDKKEVCDALNALKSLALAKLGEGHPFNGKFAAVFPALEVHVHADPVKTPEE